MKKGFTLIELIGVIVVLAIIIFIATPIVNNAIIKTEKKAFKQSAVGMIKSMESSLSDYSDELPVLYEIDEQGIRKLDSYKYNEIQYSGKIDSKGYMYMNAYESTAIYVSNKKYCAVKDILDKDVKVYLVDSKECEEGKYLFHKWQNENGIWQNADDLTVEINTSIEIPNVKAYNSEGEELETTYTVTNITNKNLIGSNIPKLESKYTTNLNDQFAVEYTAYDNSINKEIKKIVKIKVVDTTLPIISNATLKSSTNNYNSNTVNISVEASDNSNGELMMYIGVEEKPTENIEWIPFNIVNQKQLVDSLNGQNYNVYIKIKDSSGNIAEKKFSTYTVYEECSNTTSSKSTGTCSSSCSRSITYTYKDKFTSKTCSTASGGSESCSGGDCIPSTSGSSSSGSSSSGSSDNCGYIDDWDDTSDWWVSEDGYCCYTYGRCFVYWCDSFAEKGLGSIATCGYEDRCTIKCN